MGKSSHAISGVFVFMLLGIFAVFSTVMVLLSAKAYRGVVDKAAMHNSVRVASSYIRTMLRSDDETGVLKIEDAEGVHTITMENDYGDNYVTRIYVYDGKLREWFAMKEIPFLPENGETVCDLDSMDAEISDGLLKVKFEENGKEMEVYFAPRSAAPRGEE